VADDPELRARMGAQARERAEREYSIDRTVVGHERQLIELMR
jgi:hypothetical protein